MTMLKYADNPPMLSTRLGAPDEAADPWWVAHTKARAEKAFAWEMHQRGVCYYLPMHEQTRFSGGRKRRVLKPLFAGYVFFAGSEETRYHALVTGRLCQVLEPGDPQTLAAELAAIHRALSVDARLAPYTQPVIGQHCRVIAGPLAGVEGTVVEHRHRARLVLSVQMLEKAAVLEIEHDLLETSE